MSDNKAHAAAPRQVDIGLDIGIASVGWALVDASELKPSEAPEILLHGARLFDPLDDEKGNLANENRRLKRSMRRQVRRRETLRRDFVALLIRWGLVNLSIKDPKLDPSGAFAREFTDKYVNNPKVQNRLTNEYGPNYLLALRKKAITEKLSNNFDIFLILYWYLHNRGYKYDEIKEVKNKKKEKDEEKIEKNSKKPIEDYLKNLKFPIEAQFAFFEDNGFFRGDLNRRIHESAYRREIEEIFKKQGTSFLPVEFQNEYINLFLRKRSYEVGPGNEHSPTKYGLWYKPSDDGRSLEKRKHHLISLWEEKEGACTLFKTEKRAPKSSLAAELYNLLSDLNNFRSTHPNQNGKRVSMETKEQAIKLSFASAKENCSSAIRELICQEFSPHEGQPLEAKYLSGRFDDEKNLVFTPLTTFHKFRKVLIKEHKLNYSDFFDKDGNYNSKNLVDHVANVLHKTNLLQERKRLLTEKSDFEGDERYAIAQELVADKKLTDEEINKIISLKGFSETHAFSYKALSEIFIPRLYREPGLNQQEIILEERSKQGGEEDFSSYVAGSRLGNKWIEELIASPTIKRSLRQAVLVLNELFALIKKRNYKLENIVIEMAREQNAADQKEAIKKAQDNRKKQNAQIDGLLEGDDENLSGDSQASSKTKEMLWLCFQQKGHDAYDANTLINCEEIKRKPYHYEVDHIIPYSMSFDNSRSNKVLTLASRNANKKNQSPYFWDPRVVSKMTREWENWYIEPKERMFYDAKKLNYLTSTIDFSNPDNQIGFIGRNLVDTRYITKALFGALQKFAKNNKLDFLVRPINGRVTSYARFQIDDINNDDKRLKRPDDVESITNGKKNRIWHGHHAEDAYIVVLLNRYFRQQKSIETVLSLQRKWEVGDTLANLVHDGDAASIEKAKAHERAKQQQAYFNTKYPEISASFDNARQVLNNHFDKVRFSRMVITKRNLQLFNETLYSGRKTVIEGNRNNPEKIGVQKVSRLDLAKANRSTLNKYFGEDAEEKYIKSLVMCQIKRKSGQQICHGDYWELKRIYQQSLDLKGNYPLKSLMQKKGVNYIELNYTSENGKHVSRKVAKISLLKEVKEIDEVVFVSQAVAQEIRQETTQRRFPFYDSLDWLELQVYETNKLRPDGLPQLQVIKVDASNTKISVDLLGNSKWKMIPNLIQNQKAKYNIPLDAEPKFVLRRGDTIACPDNSEIVFVSGVHVSHNSLEVKYLHRDKMLPKKKNEGELQEDKEVVDLTFYESDDISGGAKKEKKQDHRTINKQLKGWKLVKVGILGQIYDKKLYF